MKFLPLLWSGIWRRPVRTVLIFLQVTVSFGLFGVLQGMKTGVDEAVANARADLLEVIPQGGVPMPIAYIDRLRAIPDVKTVTFGDGFLGTYQRPSQLVSVGAIDPTNVWLTLAPEVLKILPEDLEALRKTRTGALITADIGKKYGWHVGDRIPIKSNTLQSNGSGTWVFDIVGMFTEKQINESDAITVNYAYLDEARALNKGTVKNIYVKISKATQAVAVSDTIDRTFANSSNATGTVSFRENAQLRMRSIGDLNFAIRSIVSAVLVALLFSTATMMMQTVRERTPELAVLKTLGFTDSTVFLMVVVEALSVCLSAALLGLGLAIAVFPYASKFVPGLSMPTAVIGFGLIGAVFIALISAAVPASKAANLQVADALASR